MPFERKTLVVVPPFRGHLNPTLGVGAELLARGERVAWVGHALQGLPQGAESFSLPGQVPDGHGSALRGLRSVKFFYEEILVPLARAMLPQVERVVELWKPDLLLVDQQALAGAFAARRAGLPWVSSCTTSASVVEPLAELPKVIAWRDGLLADLQTSLGLPVVRRPGLSDQVLVFSSPALVGPVAEGVHCIGPVTGGRPPVNFPFERLKRPTVLVSLGTISGRRGERFYAAVAEAFAGLDVQAVLVAPADLVPELPENVLRFDFVPQVELLPYLDAVVTHSGHNTVVESLGAGLPLVLAPIRDDQPVVAAQVVAAGAGVRVKFGRITGDKLRKAVQTVLEKRSYRKAAKRIGAGFAELGGAVAAADILMAARKR